ncbi:PAS domain-containing protein [Aliagarivorans marinus]|uniref:PAS domain-containing protein n=1 Tax=Aliagarivorans marinus TaxID=561965 RepID=UPI000479AFFD|nr:PAS domain-containing protein [Aliagarivorans marinus]
MKLFGSGTRKVIVMLVLAYLALLPFMLLRQDTLQSQQQDWEQRYALSQAQAAVKLLQGRVQQLDEQAEVLTTLLKTLQQSQAFKPADFVHYLDETVAQFPFTGLHIAAVNQPTWFHSSRNPFADELATLFADDLQAVNALGKNHGYIAGHGQLLIYSQILLPADDAGEHASAVLTLYQQVNKQTLDGIDNIGAFNLQLHVSAMPQQFSQYPIGSAELQLLLGELNANRTTLEVKFSLLDEQARPLPWRFTLLTHNHVPALKLSWDSWSFLLFSLLLVSVFFYSMISLHFSRPIRQLIQRLRQGDTAQELDLNLKSTQQRDDELGQLTRELLRLQANGLAQRQFADLLVESIGEAIFTIDKQGLICFANPVAEHWVGRSNQQLQNSKLSFVLGQKLQPGHQLPKLLHRLVEQQQGIRSKVKLIHHGTESRIELQGFPIAFPQERHAAILLLRLPPGAAKAPLTEPEQQQGE